MPKETYIDLDENEAQWLMVLLNEVCLEYINNDYAFSVRCKLQDSMNENGIETT